MLWPGPGAAPAPLLRSLHEKGHLSEFTLPTGGDDVREVSFHHLWKMKYLANVCLLIPLVRDLVSLTKEFH